MKAKTIFLNDKDEVIIKEAMWHIDNYDNYMDNYYSNFKITDYIPLLLIKFGHVVIDLSDDYQLGVVYLPSSMSEFQKEYFKLNKNKMDNYVLYLYGNSFEYSISTYELINFIDNVPVRKIKQKEKKL